MGNSAWGHGYHKGFGDGAKQGGAIVGGAFLGAYALSEAAKYVYGKLKARKLAKADKIAAAMDDPEVDAATDPQDSI